MLGQLVAAQFDLEAVIAELARAGSSPSDAQSQLQLLGTLQRTVGSASPAGLAQLRSEIAANVSGAQAVAQLSRAAIGGEDKSERAMTKAEARAALADVGRDIFGRQVLDPYLQFESAEDERAYREREERNRRDYEREMAKGTPEGNRKAAAIVEDQLRDAEAHGAGASPDFAALAQRTQEARATLEPDAQRSVASAPEKLPERGGDQPVDGDIGDVLAALRAAGVTTLEQATSKPQHGLTVNAGIAATDRDANAGRAV